MVKAKTKIKVKKKKCSGTGKAKGHGCKELKYMHRYGLCGQCFYKWLYETEEGKETLQKTMIRASVSVKKAKPKRKYTKWQEKPLNEMIQYVQNNICNPYIRLRDIEKYGIYSCISGGGKISDCGHYFNVKNYQRLRFCIQNVNGQSYSHNRDISDPGHLNEYRQGLINRFGKKYLKELEQLEIDSRNWPKMTRIDLIEIGKTYVMLTEKRLWVFSHIEFNNYKNLINK